MMPPTKDSITASPISTRLTLIGLSLVGTNVFKILIFVSFMLVCVHPAEAQQSKNVTAIGYPIDGRWTLYGAGGWLMRANQKRIVDFALKNRVPSVWSNKEAVDADGLMSYAADLADSHRRVAYYVDRILKGAKPADLPVERPTKFELVINLKTAKQVGLTIPPNVLARADRVIK
jgi:ABC-type uncharacterized transport system substrate-binding protein